MVPSKCVKQRARFDSNPLVANAALRALREYITEGEWEDVKSTVPRQLASILP